MAENAQSWFDDTMQQIMTKIKDATTIDVVTAVVEDVIPGEDENTMSTLKNVKFRGISYYSRTTMELDGDRYDVLPASKNSEKDIRDQVIEFHTKSTSSAIKNWNNMAKIAFTGVVVAASLAGVSIDDKVTNLIDKFGMVSTE